MRDETRLEGLKQEGRWLEAAQVILDDMAEDEVTAGAWVQLGHLLKEGGAPEQAERAYRQAISLDATDWDPMLHLGHLLKSQGQLAEALAVFDRMSALPHAPDVTAERLELAVFLHPLNQHAASLSFSAPRSPMKDPAQIVLKERLDRLIKQGRPSDVFPQQSGWRRFLDRILPVKARLVPHAHLIIENGRFVATTDQPQFRIETGALLRPGSYRFEINLVPSDLPSSPRLWIEYETPWQRFSAHDFCRDQTGFCLCIDIRQPALRLRLDPVFRAGPFDVTDFRIKRIGRRKASKAHTFELPTVKSTASRFTGSDGENALAKRATGGIHPPAYQKWLSQPAAMASAAIRAQTDDTINCIQTVIVVPSANMSDLALRESLLSLFAQTPAPEVCVIVACQRPELDGPASMSIEVADDLSTALQLARGRYALILEAGGRLADDAISCFTAVLQSSPQALIAYSDEDFITEGRRHSPILKPDWDPEFQAASSYVGPCLVVGIEQALSVLQSSTQPMEWFALANRLLYSALPVNILHVDRILHHRAWIGDSLPELADIAGWTEARRSILLDILRAAGREVDTVVPGRFGLSKLIYGQTEVRADVTLIIPTRDQAALVAACVDSLLETSGDVKMHILIMDNDSREEETTKLFDRLRKSHGVTILPNREQFNFSRLCNLGVQAAQSRVVGLVNNDIVAIHEGWLDEMVRQAIRGEIGAVGAKLLYRSGHVQHAGIVCGIGRISGHPHKYAEAEEPGYLGRLAVRQTVSAVTGACLFVEKRKYQEVGGMDEAAFPVAFNDVDLCLKLDARGYRNLFTPHATLYHLESLSRGRDVTPEKRQRYMEEGNIMLERWESRIRRDPYYNRHLTRCREDYSLGK